MMYLVITPSDGVLGLYDHWEDAYMFATINIGMEGWTITTT